MLKFRNLNPALVDGKHIVLWMVKAHCGTSCPRVNGIKGGRLPRPRSLGSNCEELTQGTPWILEPSATGLCEPDLHVFAKLFEDRLERGLEAQALSGREISRLNWVAMTMSSSAHGAIIIATDERRETARRVTVAPSGADGEKRHSLLQRLRRRLKFNLQLGFLPRHTPLSRGQQQTARKRRMVLTRAREKCRAGRIRP